MVTDRVAWIVLPLTILAAFAPELTFTRAFFYFDLSDRFLPQRAWGFEQIRAGYFPFWCPHYGLGMPFLGEGETGILYPPNWLTYLWLPPWVALTVTLVAHHVLAAVGMYALARQWATPSGALLAGVAYALGGRMLAHQIHPPILEVVAWFPLLLVSVHRLTAVERPLRSRWLAVAAAIHTLQWLAGSPQVALCCGVGAAAFGLAATAEQAPRRGVAIVAAGVVIVLLTLLLAAPQILPLHETWQQSVRADGLKPEALRWGEVPPMLWLGASLPYLWGRLGDGTAWLNGLYPWGEMGWYHGALSMPLAAVGVTLGAAVGRWRASVLLVVGLVLAAGTLQPAGMVLADLPGFSALRAADRFLVLASVGLCLAMALGWDALLADRRGARTTLVAATAVLIVAAAGVIGWCYAEFLPPELGEFVGLAQSAEVQAKVTMIRRSMLGQWLPALLQREALLSALGIGLGITGAWLTRRGPVLATWVVFAVLAVDVGRWNRTEFPETDPGFYQPPPVVAWIKEHCKIPRVYLENPPRMQDNPRWLHDTQYLHDYRSYLSGERGLLWGIGTLPCELPLADRGQRYPVSADAEVVIDQGVLGASVSNWSFVSGSDTLQWSWLGPNRIRFTDTNSDAKAFVFLPAIRGWRAASPEKSILHLTGLGEWFHAARPGVREAEIVYRPVCWPRAVGCFWVGMALFVLILWRFSWGEASAATPPPWLGWASGGWWLGLVMVAALGAVLAADRWAEAMPRMYATW